MLLQTEERHLPTSANRTDTQPNMVPTIEFESAAVATSIEELRCRTRVVGSTRDLARWMAGAIRVKDAALEEFSRNVFCAENTLETREHMVSETVWYNVDFLQHVVVAPLAKLALLRLLASAQGGNTRL